MTQGSGQTETVRGAVEQANPKGIKVGGRWFNFSQYSASVTHPDVGDEIEMEVAKGKFIDSLTVLGGQEIDSDTSANDEDFAGFDTVPAAARPAPRNTASAVPRVATPGGEGRNAEIRRLALVKAAAEYAAGRTELTPDDVQAIAAQWENWVTGSG